MGRTLLLAIFLLAALTVPVALSAGPTTDGTLSVKRGKGALVLKLQGHGDRPRERQRPGEGPAPVRRQHARVHRLQAEAQAPEVRRSRVCKGRNVGFRVTNGRFNVNVRGVAISISAVGRGPVTVDGIGDEGVADGVMSVDAAPYESLPDDPTILTLGTPPAGG